MRRTRKDHPCRARRYRGLITLWRRVAQLNDPQVQAGHRSVKKRDVILLADKAAKKARRRLREASTSTDDEALHRARKAFKRARYAAELTTALVGRKKAKRAVGRYKHVQEVLGEHQDSLVAASFLRRLGAATGTRNGENGFTYGLLFANEQNAAAAAQHAARSIRI